LSWNTPYSTRVDSLTNFQYTYAEEDDLTVEDLIEDPASLSETELDNIKQIALAQPLIKDRLLSPDANVTGLNLSFELPSENAEQAPFEIMEHIDAMLADIETRYPNLETAKTGVVPMNKAFPEASFKDMQTLIPAAFAIILLGFLLLTRSFWGTIASVIVMLMSIMAAMVTFFQQMRAGQDKVQSIRESIRVNFNPIFLTSVTTAIGFLSMNFSDSPPFHDLGTITAIGVVYAFILSIFFLPALTAVLPVKPPVVKKAKSGLMEHLANFSIARYRFLLAAVGVLIVALIAMVPRNEFNDEFVKYFDETLEFRQDTDLISEKLTGMYFIDYSFDSKTESGINTPEYLQQLESFEYWLQSQPEVLHVNSVSETFRRLNKNMHGDDSSWYKLPEDKELAAQYLLLYEMSLPYGLDLNT